MIYKTLQNTKDQATRLQLSDNDRNIHVKHYTQNMIVIYKIYL